MRKLFKFIIYTLLFIVVFGISAAYRSITIIGMGSKDVFTLQKSSEGNPLAANEFEKDIIDIRYITKDKKVAVRPIILYTPASAKGPIPLIYVPHYAVKEQSEDFKAYIRNGWAVASPYQFDSKYNAVLVTDGLVFNNAALHALRGLSIIDRQRIALVGGSAGGYTTLMLSQLQMGTTASIANSPIANVYFNFHVHFLQCDSINRNAGAFSFPIPIQGMVSKLFRPINDNFKDDRDPLWEAVSPLSMAGAFSNPTVINHNTGDILVPIDQITKKYSYKINDGTLPEGFTGQLGKDYAGMLSSSLEDRADPLELSIKRFSFKHNKVVGAMPYSDKRLTINVIDDGPISAKGSHSAPGTTGNYDIIPYLKIMFSKTLKVTEQAIPEKLLILLERYQGKSKQLPPHVGIDDTVYGSLAIYQKEIVEELLTYSDNNSLDTLEEIIMASIKSSPNNNVIKQGYIATWNEIKGKLHHP